MNKVLLLTFVLMFGATMAFAQAGTIGIYSDPAGTSCNLTATPGLVFYYFLHVNTAGATGSDWAAPAPTCLPAVYIGMNVPSGSIYVGNTETGISIGYSGEECHTRTYLIVSSLYSVLGPATDCCRWSVGPHPRFPTITGSDCHFDRTYPSGGEGIINTTPACPCGAVPTEDTTWGQVKALYAE